MPLIESINRGRAYMADDGHRHRPTGDERRYAILSYINEQLHKGKYNITYPEIAKATKLNLDQVRYHFEKLEIVGAIRVKDRDPNSVIGKLLYLPQKGGIR